MSSERAIFFAGHVRVDRMTDDVPTHLAVLDRDVRYLTEAVQEPAESLTPVGVALSRKPKGVGVAVTLVVLTLV